MAREKGENQPNYEEDLDCIDFQNYKGMFYNEDAGLKYQDEATGAHFEHKDMCRRLNKLKSSLENHHETVKENKIISTLKDCGNARMDKRKKSSIGKDIIKLIPHVQETRNTDPRPAHLYSTTISEMVGKGKLRKPNIQRNYSIGHKQCSGNALVKENLPNYKGARKTPGKTT